MQTSTLVRSSLLLVSALLVSARLSASAIVPTSYSYSASGGYSGSYPDDTGAQLTDGAYNDIVPHANLATPNAYNWVGFENVDAFVTFQFAESFTIDNVSLDMARWQAAGVYLPEKVLVNGNAFSINASDYDDQNKALLSFNGAWTGTSLTLELKRAGQWTFVDEVTFDGHKPDTRPTPGVPDSGATLSLLGLAGLSLGLVRKKLTR